MSVLIFEKPAVPRGSLIVISGVTGFIGSHVADQALAAGYRVRGTTRSVQRGAWAERYFRHKYGPDSFGLVEVPDMAAENAFGDAAKDAVGFIHVANDMTASTDANVAITRAVNGALNALRASANEPGMQRFVYTSSSFAATSPKPNKRFTITVDSFNDEAVERASKPGADGPTVYSASKVAAERAISKWLKENMNSLVVNYILPNANIGPLLSSANQGYPTSARWVKALWDGDYGSLKGDPPQHYVNVQDDARLHIIALANHAVRNERIFAVAAPVSITEIVRVLQKLYPQREWKDYPDDGQDLCIFEPIQRAEALLKEAYGFGFTGLEESVKGNSADLAL